jgi:hypothetical protein
MTASATPRDAGTGQATSDARATPDDPRSATAVRVGLAVLAAGGLLVGVWATFAPASFYSTFPGLGLHWVDIDGPYNEHLVRDVGQLNLALAVITIIAAVRLGTTVVRAACIGWLVFAVPHQLYHATHRAGLGTGDFIGEMVTLAFEIVVPIALLVLVSREGWRVHERPATVG